MRASNYYCAFTNHPNTAITPMSIGHATPAHELGVLSLQVQPRLAADTEGSNVVVLILYPFAGEVMGYMLQMSDELTKGALSGTTYTPFDKWTDLTDTNWTTKAPKSFEIRASSWGQDRPSEVLPTRFSTQILNHGAKYQRGGKVRVLRATTGYEWPTTNEKLLDIANKIRLNKRTEKHEGDEFGHPHQINSIIADAFKAGSFKPYAARPPNHETDSPALDVYKEEVRFPAMSVTMLLFEPYGTSGGTGVTPNQYEINLAANYYSHDIQGTRLGNQAILPKSGAAQVNAHTNHEETKGLIPVAKKLGNAALGLAGQMVETVEQVVTNPTPAQRRFVRTAGRAALRGARRARRGIPAIRYA